MDAAHRGEAALQNSDPASAVAHYTTALVSSPESPVYYLKRCIALHRIGDYGNALSDAECAIVAALKRGKRELMAEGQVRRGITLAAMDRVQDAHISYEGAHKFGYKGKDLAILEARLKVKRKGLEWSDPKMQKNIEEMPTRALPTTINLPEKSQISSVDVASVSNGAPSKSIDAKASEPAETAQPPPAQTGSASPAAGNTTAPAPIRHEWYQNNESVYVTIFAKGVPKDRASIEIETTNLHISFPLPSGADYAFSADPFFAEVDAQTSKWKIFGTKVEVTLAKRQPGVKWASLEGSDLPQASATATTAATEHASKPTQSQPVNPYSSRGGQSKNWDKIANSFQKASDSQEEQGGEAKGGNEIKIGEDDDEADDANFFFKKLFKGATPEQQRAMMKSYQESSGTSLSTNWEEVSKGPVEVQPPEGMVAKKY